METVSGLHIQYRNYYIHIYQDYHSYLTSQLQKDNHIV